MLSNNPICPMLSRRLIYFSHTYRRPVRAPHLHAMTKAADGQLAAPAVLPAPPPPPPPASREGGGSGPPPGPRCPAPPPEGAAPRRACAIVARKLPRAEGEHEDFPFSHIQKPTNKLLSIGPCSPLRYK